MNLELKMILLSWNSQVRDADHEAERVPFVDVQALYVHQRSGSQELPNKLAVPWAINNYVCI